MRTIETERLILRPLTQEDANAVFEWAGDPLVNKYMPYPLHQSVRQAKEWIRSLGDKNEFCFCESVEISKINNDRSNSL